MKLISKAAVCVCLRRSILGVCLATALLALPSNGWGQSVTGSISGVVADESGAVIPGATVTVVHLETNFGRTMNTQSDGRYRFAGLPVGSYSVTVEASGFAKFVRSPIVLTLNQAAIVDVPMKIAAVGETVVVVENASALNTTNAEVGVRFDSRRMSELPLSPTRDIFGIALSAAGVSQLSTGNSEFAAGVNFSVNGQRIRSNNFVIDAQDSNDPSVTGRQQVMNNPDIVQEFRLITNQPSAEYGRSAGSTVSIITKSGSNEFHGSAFWFHNDNKLNSRNNLDEARAKANPSDLSLREAPWRIENQFGATGGGPIWKNHTFFFASIQRWTDRQLGSGTTLRGSPTEAGRQLLQSLGGSRPQVQALLQFLPAGTGNVGTAPITLDATPRSDCLTPTPPASCQFIELGSLTGSTTFTFNDWQWSGRIDHRIGDKHTLGGRYLYNDADTAGSGQATPPGLTTVNFQRQQAMTLFLSSILTPRFLNDVRLSWQRLGNVTTASDPSSETIPSIEIPELGLTGFNAATSRTAIGLAVNLPQFRFNNTFQLQETVSYTVGKHALKFGIDFRRIDAKSFFFPVIRGRLVYDTLDAFVDDDGGADTSVVNINTPLPGGVDIQYYLWYDYFAFVQDEWRVTPTFTLSYGLRYETPGQALFSLIEPNQRIIAAAGNDSRFALAPIPKRDKNNFQPRFGFSWNPRTETTGFFGRVTGGNKLVLRGGYARTNDYAFINLVLNVASSFPFVAAINQPGLANAFTAIGTLSPSGLNPLQLTRTIVGEDYRAPAADQYSLEIQREFGANWVLRVGSVATKGTGLFQTIDGNPRLPFSTTRVDPTLGVRRLRANAASSIYHSLQTSLERRLSGGLAAGVHYTWSKFIDTASDTFNPSVSGEVAIAQDSFNRGADRALSTFDRTHRFAANFVYELPWYRNQLGAVGHLLGGWQLNASVSLQSGAPFGVLNGSDPTGALGGISGLVGDAIRANANSTVSSDISSMSVQQIWNAGRAALFCPLVPPASRPECPTGQRVGNLGRNILRADGITNIDIGIIKNTNIRENHRIQFRVEMYNMTNTRNFGIPEARQSSANFLNQWGTNGGNRRIIAALRYTF